MGAGRLRATGEGLDGLEGLGGSKDAESLGYGGSHGANRHGGNK